jgi:hypothetical protein
MTEKLQAKLAELPKEPGVYFHKDAKGEIIYVGKAAVLRNRVRQYFQASRNRDPKTEALVEEIVDVDWMVVESELEALFLEAEMIRPILQRPCRPPGAQAAAPGISLCHPPGTGAEARQPALPPWARPGTGGGEDEP